MRLRAGLVELPHSLIDLDLLIIAVTYNITVTKVCI